MSNIAYAENQPIEITDPTTGEIRNAVVGKLIERGFEPVQDKEAEGRNPGMRFMEPGPYYEVYEVKIYI